MSTELGLSTSLNEKVVGGLRSLYQSFRAPNPWILSKSEKERIRKIPRFEAGQTMLGEAPVYFLDSASFLSTYISIFENHIYKFQKSSAGKLRVLDCGGYIGLSALYFLKEYPESQVTVFEPDPKNFALLQKNTARFADRIACVQAAVWTGDGQMNFGNEGADGGRMVEINSSTQITVKTVALSNYLQEPIDFLKIDIEGAEADVFPSLVPQLGQVKNLFLEYHSFENSPQQLAAILSILSAAGFRLHLKNPAPNPWPFVENIIHNGMDLQLEIFAFRK